MTFPARSPGPGPEEFKGGYRAPRAAGTLVMALVLVALGMLFAASLLGYVLIRLQHASRLALGSVELPGALWLSTALMLAGSVTMHRALRAVRLERQREFRNWLVATLALAGAFLAVQAPSMAVLLARHWRTAGASNVATYGLVITLIFVHALHVIGGMVALGTVAAGAFRGRYDHESHGPVRHATVYWHFLDAVWIAMYAVMLLAR